MCSTSLPEGRRPRGLPSGTTAAAIAAALLAGCSVGESGNAPAGGPGPGVVFAYPIDGQWDVPLRSQLVLRFSRAIPAAVDAACSRTGGRVSGAFCVEGPDGFVPGTVKVDGALLTFSPSAALAPGATYRVWARPALLPGATNLSADAPLVTFHARSTRPRPGEAATVLTLNGSPLADGGASAKPIHDVAPLRLVFSEPLDPTTVTTRTVRVVRVADGRAVDGFVVASGIHLTFQPAQPLTPGDAYRLEIGTAAHDLGGEAVAQVSLPFSPVRTAAPGKELFHLPMIVDPPFAPGSPPPASPLDGNPVNTYRMSSTIDGNTAGGVIASGLDAFAGDPTAAPRIPLLIKRGGRMNQSARDVPLGGVVRTGNRTGVLHFTLLTDAFGFQMRNPFRGPGQEPDDAEAPTFLDLTMDAVVSSDDHLGNNISNQTILGIHVLGIFRPENGELVCDQLASIDYQVFGLETAPISMALRMRTGGAAMPPDTGVPALTASTPLDGARDVPPGDSIELDFSGPLDPDSVFNDLTVTLEGAGVAVPATVRTYGTSLLVVPSRRLDEGALHTLRWSGLRSVAGAPIPEGTLSFTTAVHTAPVPVPPILLALLPGAPCALTGGTASSPGRCAGGQSTDARYLPFTLAANRDVRAYFSLPVDPASLTLGTACGQGSVRVEKVTAATDAGTCTGVVPGTLVKLDRELRFVPAAPWTPGAFYRITLVGGPERGTCTAGVICGRGTALPLNTDPLNGFARGAGGPDVVINFTATSASAEVLQPLVSDGVADQNANGYVDGGEQVNDRNRAMAEIARYTKPLFTDVSFTGTSACDPDRTGKVTCAYTSAALPSIIRGVVDHCPLDPQGNTSTMPYPCLETATVPGVVLQTTSAMQTESLYGLMKNASDSGMRLSRLIEAGGQPILGYIFNEAGLADPQFLMVQESYTDAPDLSIPDVQHDLRSKRSRMVLKGPLRYRPDGRTVVSLRSLNDSTITVNLSTTVAVVVPLSGSVDILTRAGEMRITLSEPIKR